jgi:hypothetical protein
MNKLEKVALRCAPKRGRPLVLVINNIHFFQNDEAGRSMLLQLQQKAEVWAASGKLRYLIFVSVVRGLILFLIYIRYFDDGFHHVSFTYYPLDFDRLRLSETISGLSKL